MTRVRVALRRPIVACAVLFVVYLGLSLLNDSRGYLGTDTGGKVATLKVMAADHTVDPNLGYWAERWDPSGRLHPLYYTAHIDGRWVNVTTLPALLAAYPLYRLGGYRLALLLPMFGSILTALAGRALARRMVVDGDGDGDGDSDSHGDGSANAADDGDRRLVPSGPAEPAPTTRRDRIGWTAFWVVGLASPALVYALDFWEHSIGAALVTWSAVALVAALDRGVGSRRRAALAGGAGLLLGTAATMRTEALAYAAVFVAVVGLVLLIRERRILPPLVVALTAMIGLAVPLMVNQGLERAIVGAPIRSSRAAGTAAGAGGAIGVRLHEVAVTAVGLEPAGEPRSWRLGAALSALLVAGVWLAARTRRRGPDAGPTPAAGPTLLAARASVVLLAVAGALYVTRFAEGNGFVPGLVPAAPLAAAALARGWPHRRCRLPMLMAVAALPLVWAADFTGGALAQWGGRYILPTSILLTVVGATCLADATRWARRSLIAVAVAVTAFGAMSLVARSHQVATAEVALDRGTAPVVVSEVAHLAREGGAFYRDRRWLTAPTSADADQAAAIVRMAGFGGFDLVQEDGRPAPTDIDGFTRGSTRRVPYIGGTRLEVTTYASS